MGEGVEEGIVLSVSRVSQAMSVVIIIGSSGVDENVRFSFVGVTHFDGRLLLDIVDVDARLLFRWEMVPP